jgi:hypothetical protein
MSTKKIALIVVVCALAAVSVVGAQVVIQAFARQYLNTGIFSVGSRETANIYVSLDDQSGEAPAHVVLQLFDETGTEVGHNEATLAPGQSLRLVAPGPGLFRAHAEVINTTFNFTRRRTGVGTVEVIDNLTAIPRRIPNFHPHPIPDQP